MVSRTTSMCPTVQQQHFQALVSMQNSDFFEQGFFSRCRMGKVLSVAIPPSDYAPANLANVVGRVPGALGPLLDAVRDLGLEDAGKLGAAIAKVASLLEEGDLPALEDTIGDIFEAG